MPVHVKILNIQKNESLNALEITLLIDNQQRYFRADFKWRKSSEADTSRHMKAENFVSVEG